MSNLIDRLISNLEDLFSQRLSPNNKQDEKLFEETGENLNDLLSLGENTHRMFEIGMMQDELVKLGFKLSIWNTVRNVSKIDYMVNDNDIGIYFWDSYVFFDMKRYPYDSPTFRQDFLNKVKELINHE